jgi:hypothetical protein
VDNEGNVIKEYAYKTEVTRELGNSWSRLDGKRLMVNTGGPYPSADPLNCDAQFSDHDAWPLNDSALLLTLEGLPLCTSYPLSPSFPLTEATAEDSSLPGQEGLIPKKSFTSEMQAPQVKTKKVAGFVLDPRSLGEEKEDENDSYDVDSYSYDVDCSSVSSGSTAIVEPDSLDSLDLDTDSSQEDLPSAAGTASTCSIDSPNTEFVNSSSGAPQKTLTASLKWKSRERSKLYISNSVSFKPAQGKRRRVGSKGITSSSDDSKKESSPPKTSQPSQKKHLYFEADDGTLHNPATTMTHPGNSDFSASIALEVFMPRVPRKPFDFVTASIYPCAHTEGPVSTAEPALAKDANATERADCTGTGSTVMPFPPPLPYGGNLQGALAAQDRSAIRILMKHQSDHSRLEREAAAKVAKERGAGSCPRSKETDTEELLRLRKEVAALTHRVERAEQRADGLDDDIYIFEQKRHEMKALLLDSKKALIAAGVSAKRKFDANVPEWYGQFSWAESADIPWNAEEKRAMTPAEGIGWLSSELAKEKSKTKELRKRLKNETEF